MGPLRQRRRKENGNRDQTKATKKANGFKDGTKDAKSTPKPSHMRPASLAKTEPNNSVDVSKVDSFLGTYCDYIYETRTMDVGLKVLVYTIWLVAWATRTSPDPWEGNNVFSSSMYEISGEIHMARYVLRLFSFPEAVEGVRSGSWAKGKWEDPRITFIAKYFMAGSMLVFYPLDHMAYFGWIVPQLVKNADWYFSHSCRWWMVYLIANLSICRLKLIELKKKSTELELFADTGKTKKTDGGDHEFDNKDVMEKQENLKNNARCVKLEMLCSVLTLIPAITWSDLDWEEDPMAGESIVNGLMSIEAYTSLYQSIIAPDEEEEEDQE